MQFKELEVILTEINPFSEILIARLNEINFEAYIEHEKGIKAYIKSSLFDKSQLIEIMNNIASSTKISYKINDIDQENWNQKWESEFEPVHINDHCVVRAHFHNSFPEIEHELIITPKMSFGTGHHPTTFLMLNKMFELDFKKKKVLDIGSGTGVLSILASKLGANQITGVDNDEWAFNNSNENRMLNNVSNIQFINGTTEELDDSMFDIILVNINRETIIKELDYYYSIMGQGADILLSGFLLSDVPLILNKSEQLFLRLVSSKNMNEWHILHLRKD